MDIFKDISSATAIRDLKSGVEFGLFDKLEEKNERITHKKICDLLVRDSSYNIYAQ